VSSRRVNGTSRGFHDDTAAMGVLRGVEEEHGGQQREIERKRARPTTVSACESRGEGI
jgi:hypothetical protein